MSKIHFVSKTDQFMKLEYRKTFAFVVLLLLSSLLSTSLTAATYTVGGAGADYATLNALRLSGILTDGDTIVLNGNDFSLERISI